MQWETPREVAMLINMVVGTRMLASVPHRCRQPFVSSDVRATYLVERLA